VGKGFLKVVMWSPVNHVSIPVNMQGPVSLDPSMRSLLFAGLVAAHCITHLPSSDSRTVVWRPAVYSTGLIIYSSDCLVIRARMSSHSVKSILRSNCFFCANQALPPTGLAALRSCNLLLWRPLRIQVIYQLRYRVLPVS
jgi:hypothetical protein